MFETLRCSIRRRYAIFFPAPLIKAGSVPYCASSFDLAQEPTHRRPFIKRIFVSTDFKTLYLLFLFDNEISFYQCIPWIVHEFVCSD